MDKDAIGAFFSIFEPFFLWYFGSLNLFYTFLIFLGSLKVYFRHQELKHDRFSPILQSNCLPEIAILVPMYNESKVIVESVESILRLTYRYKKIIIINDGSIDDSVDIVVKAFDMVAIPKFYKENLNSENIRKVYRSRSNREIFLLDKEHGGKFDAVNAGINVSDSPYFLLVDGDTFIDNTGFEALIRPILSDPKTVSVGASVRIRNGCVVDYNRISTTRFPQNYLPSMQGVEYMRVFLTRLGWDYFNGNFIVAGAFSLFPRDLIAKAGGFCNSVGEDVEIIVRLHRIMKETKTKYKIFYVPDPIAWTTAPEKLEVLSKQRTRWHLAVLETLFHHKRMCLNPRYGFIGLLVYPFWVIGEAIEPVIEILGYLYILVLLWLGALHLPFLIFYLALSFGLIFLYTFYSLLTEDLSFHKYPSIRSIFLMVLSCFAENIGYHQITLIWRVKAFYQFVKKLPFLRKEAKAIKAKIAKAKRP